MRKMKVSPNQGGNSNMYRNYVRSIMNGQVFHQADTGVGAGGSSESSSDSSGGKEESSNEDNSSTEKDDNKSGSDDSSKESKGFTQDDVNNLVARETKKATEKLLKQLGVTDFKTAKEGLDKFKEIQDSQKTEAQKVAEKAEALGKTNTELANQVGTLNAQLAALKADVNPDSLQDVIVLANNLISDDVTIDDAIKQVLKKYPNFKRAAQESGKKAPKFSEGEHKSNDKPSEADQWSAAFKF
jgi:hypothetical protein